MKKYKKNLSFLLAFVMALSLMPGMRLTAQADGNVASVTKGSETTNYASFNEAVTEWASTSGATLKLLADVTKDSTITISAGTESSPVILDLNGYGILSTSSSSVISVGDGNYFTLKDTGSDSTTHY
nr:hypothetical protein [Eubacterium sp.]